MYKRMILFAYFSLKDYENRLVLVAYTKKEAIWVEIEAPEDLVNGKWTKKDFEDRLLRPSFSAIKTRMKELGYNYRHLKPIKSQSIKYPHPEWLKAVL